MCACGVCLSVCAATTSPPQEEDDAAFVADDDEEEDGGGKAAKQQKTAAKSSKKDDGGDVLVCELSRMRRVSVRTYNGKTYVDLREVRSGIGVDTHTLTLSRRMAL